MSKDIDCKICSCKPVIIDGWHFEEYESTIDLTDGTSAWSLGAAVKTEIIKLLLGRLAMTKFITTLNTVPNAGANYTIKGCVLCP